MGGMAELLLARERGVAGLDRLVVIKRILAHLAERPAFVEMFLREARLIAQLNHPNVVQIIELGESDGQYFLAMEYIHGLTVRELTRRATDAGIRIPYSVGLSIVMQACRGLHAAHELADLSGRPLGIVHRDVSPHNLMLADDGHVKILDFGIAKPTQHMEPTLTTSLKGKLSYMSPEQCRHEPVDRRADIFALGIVLWELCTGERLFKRRTEMDTMQAVAAAEVPSPSEVDRNFLPALEAVVMKALARKPADRFDTADQMRREIERAAHAGSLRLGEDRVAVFVDRMAGDLLANRRERVQAATDAPARVEATPPPTPAARAAGSVGGNRTWLLIAGLGVVLVVAFASAYLLNRTPSGEGFSVPVPQGEPVDFCWPPFIDEPVLLEDVEPLRTYLEQAVERPFRFTVTSDYDSCAQGVATGQYSVGSLSPLLYLRTSETHPDLEVIGVKEFDGVATYESVLLVSTGSTVMSLDGLRGGRFCFTDPDSTSGYVMPRAHIRSLGHDPDAFVGSIQWSGDHLQALRDLFAGRCDVVATYPGAVLSGAELGLPVGSLRHIAVTGVLPQDVIVTPGDLDPQLADAIRRAILEFDPQAHLGLTRVGDNQRITGYAAMDESAFDALRELVRAELESAPAPN